ncbi:alpha/beta fold hydrolase [Gulosibacter sediminis]|uniref:alpha/beta fold hydrolase n=1 Tax=Gulosibacter sediminis TaxID=1729695 RepID=UPI0024AD932B|nr:alpha/beta hydrolase [Gulosibacter sediminis]
MLPSYAGTHPLADGRWLQWVRFGDAQAPPVLSFHGAPGSRFEAALYNRAAAHFGVQVVCLSRPGFALSTWRPHRNVANFIDDVESFVAARSWSRFAVVGYSAGGAYALATALAMPEQVSGVGLLAPAGPPQYTGMPMGPNLAIFAGAAASVGALGHNSLFTSARQRAGLGLDRRFGLPDASGDAFLDSVVGAFRRGPRGVALDLSLVLFDWGFDPAELDQSIPVTMWQGKRDLSVPWRGSMQLARRIPNCEFHLDRTANHFSVYTRHADEVLSKLAR